jgi:hypothetical protein
VQAIPPTLIEVMRARLLDEDKLRDATLLAVLAYAGLRPQEALALEWRHVRGRTLLVERALSDGQLKALKNRRQPRTVALLTPLRDDLAVWRRASLPPASSSPLFPSGSGGFWRASDWRNWRKRIYRPVAEQVGIDSARPYELRHAFASLLIHEGRLSVVDIAAQLGHNPTVCLDTYAHVMAEQRDGVTVSAEEQILQARHAARSSVELAVATESPSGPELLPARPRSGAGLDRIAIFPTARGGYGVDLTYDGAAGRNDARAAEQLLRAAGLTSSAHQGVDGSWTVRFGPVPRERVHALLEHFAW